MGEFVGRFVQRTLPLEVIHRRLFPLNDHLHVQLVTAREDPHWPWNAVAKAGQSMRVLSWRTSSLPNDQLVDLLFVATRASGRGERQLLKRHRRHVNYDSGEEPLVDREPVLAPQFTANRSSVNQRIHRGPNLAAYTFPGIQHFVAERVRHRFPELCVIEEVVVRPIVQRTAAVRPGATVKADIQRTARADKVHLFQGLREGVAKRFNYPGRICMVRIVNGQGLPAITRILLDGRLDSIHSEAGKVEAHHFVWFTFYVVIAGGVRWIPVSDAQENPLIRCGAPQSL